MSSKTNSQKIKLIQIKDIIAILLVSIILTITLTGVLGTNETPDENKTVTTRNLAMFASLAYADLEKVNNGNYIRKSTNVNSLKFTNTQMVTDKQLKTLTSSTILGLMPLSRQQEDTYSYLFYDLATTEEVKDWKIINYAKMRTTLTNGSGLFTAITFQRDNDIVIAYRGTDFDDLGDWMQDLAYGIVGFTGQETITQNYALKIAEAFPNSNIYITGHSLGGYLAQIGGAALVGNENYKDNVAQIAYFNGMGLHFWSNIKNHLTDKTKLSKYGINQTELNELTNNNSKLNKIQNEAKRVLSNWCNEKYILQANSQNTNVSNNKLVSYYINGDLISSLGTHVGNKIGFNAYDTCIEHHEGNQIITNLLATTAFKIIKPFLNTDVSEYVNQYKPASLLSYIWITHETDSFFGALPFDDGTLPGKIDVKLINVPTNIRRNKTAKAQLVVTTTGGSLMSTRLTLSNFTITNKASLKLISISGPIKKQTSTGYQYTYTLNLKGGSLTGLSQIKFNSNALKLLPGHNYKLKLITNDSIISNIITTKLF